LFLSKFSEKRLFHKAKHGLVARGVSIGIRIEGKVCLDPGYFFRAIAIGRSQPASQLPGPAFQLGGQYWQPPAQSPGQDPVLGRSTHYGYFVALDQVPIQPLHCFGAQQGATNPQYDNLTTENNDIIRIIIKSKRIKSYRFMLAVSNHNRIFAYQIVSKWTTEYIISN
jgi:hypothetical protein